MKKLLSVLLAIMLLLSATPVFAESETATTGSGTESEPWVVYSWSALKEKMALGGYIKLGEDVTDPDHTRETYLYVPADRMVDLELNGFAVNRNLGTTQIRDGSVIQVDGILNLRDSSAEKTGKITGGHSSSYTEYGDRHTGGGIFVNGGTLNMYSGSVCNNRATDGGGIYARKGTVIIYGGSVCNNITYNQAAGIYLQTSSLYMQDGLISNNETSGRGGGVYLYLKSTFVMDGGTISENTCGDGGGVYLQGELGIETNPSSFTMNGGSITKNTVEESDYYSGQGGGVYAGTDSTFNLNGGTISENTSTFRRSPASFTMELGAGVYFYTGSFSIKGKPAVTGNVSVNRNGGKTIPGNIYVPRNQRINVADALEEGASFGLICQDYEAEVTSGFKTYNSEDEPTAFFTSDIAEYKVIKNDSGEAEIKRHTHTLTPVEKVAADCVTAGKEAYYHCSGCGKDFEDENGNTVIADIDTWGIIDALGHDYSAQSTEDKYLKTAATCKNVAEYYYSCSRCGEADPVNSFEYGTVGAHQLTKVDEVQADCLNAGKSEYYVCDVCGKYFKEETGTTEIADIDGYGITAPLGHDFGDNEKVCKRCGTANPDYKEPTPAPVLTPEEAAMPTEEKTEELVKKTNTDKKDVAGAEYQRLMLKATSKKKTITLKWKKINGASGYIVYGAPCGKKMTRLATISNPKTVKKTFKKLKKGKYYKYIVVAYKKTAAGNRIMSKSKSVHCATPGGKKGNPTGIKLKKTKITLKKGKKTKIKATLQSKGKVATHIAKFRYESSNKKIATVDKNGNIKAKKKGTVTIYVYAQNGLCKTIKVKVK